MDYPMMVNSRPAWLLLFARECGHYSPLVALKSGLLPIGAVCAAMMLIQLPFLYLFRKVEYPKVAPEP